MKPAMTARTLAEETVRIPVTLHWLWAPLGLLLALPAPALVGSLLIPGGDYPQLFGQPKFLDGRIEGIAVMYLIVLLLIFAITVPMRSTATTYIELDPRGRRWVNHAVLSVSFVTFAAYVVWISAALVRGLRFESVLALLNGDPGTMYVLRSQYFETLGGVTTWMQLAALAAPLAILRAKAGGKSARTILIWLFGFALLRALLNSERLALIEIAVSAILAVAILRPAAPRLLRSLPSSVLLIFTSWGALYLVFAIFEYFRSWTIARSDFGGGFWSYISSLLLGYYTTALNLAAFDIKLLDGKGVPGLMFDGDFYNSLFGPSPIAGAQKAYGLETFTNRSGLLTPYGALGVFGGLAVIIGLGVAFAILARRTVAGNPVAFAVYCASAVGLLEIVRIFSTGRPDFCQSLLLQLFSGRPGP